MLRLVCDRSECPNRPDVLTGVFSFLTLWPRLQSHFFPIPAPAALGPKRCYTVLVVLLSTRATGVKGPITCTTYALGGTRDRLCFFFLLSPGLTSISMFAISGRWRTGSLGGCSAGTPHQLWLGSGTVAQATGTVGMIVSQCLQDTVLAGYSRFIWAF